MISICWLRPLTLYPRLGFKILLKGELLYMYIFMIL